MGGGRIHIKTFLAYKSLSILLGWLIKEYNSWHVYILIYKLFFFSTTKDFRISLCVCSVTQSYATFCDPMDCSLPGSSVHGILQARILEWLLFPSPEDLPDPRIRKIFKKMHLLHLLHWQADSLPWEPPGKSQNKLSSFAWFCLINKL